MARHIKVNIDNQEYDAVEQDFEIKREEWNEYRLLDGGVVRVKTTVQKIARILESDGKPAYTSDGDPFFLVTHNTQVISTE